MFEKDAENELEKSLDVVRGDLETLDKSRYIKRWRSNGEWHYKYPAGKKRNATRKESKNEIAKTTKLITGIKPLVNAAEKEIDEALVKLSIYAMDGKLKCPALGNHGVYVTSRTQEHIKESKGAFRTTEAMRHKAKYIPFVSEILKHGKISEKSSSNKGAVYGIIGQVEYFDETKNKAVRESVELAVNFDKDTRKYVFSFADYQIKKSLLENKDFSMTTFVACPVGACDAEALSTTDEILPLNNRLVKGSDKKSLKIVMSDITEGNRAAKYGQLEKALAGMKAVKIPADNTPELPLLNINLKDCSRERVNKALRAAAFTLDVPLKSAKGEGFTFKAQEDLTDRWCGFFSKIVRGTYDLVIRHFGLPEIAVMSKSENIVWKGKVLYSPESGEPIKKSEWDLFVKALEKFLNRNIANAAEKIVLDGTALGKILDRMARTNSLEAVKKMRLDSLKYANKTFDWISDSVKNMRNVSGDFLSRSDCARIQIMRDSAAEKITRISDDMKSDIRQILIDGALERKSKGQVSQMIFDKMIGHNRDFQRIADTEIQRASTNAFVKEEVQRAEDGEKVYFKRVEVVDDNTCEYCKRINGKIAVWSDVPLSSGAVKDGHAELAIWEGKEWSGKKLTRIGDAPVSICHPWCRGVWIRHYPEFDGGRTVKKSLDDGGIIEKSHKYIRRRLDTSGQWKCEYPNQYKGEHSAKHRAHVKAEIAKKTDLIENVNPINPDCISAVNKKLDELETLSKNGKLKYRNTSVVFYKKKFRKHLENTNGKKRDEDELKTRKA